jgi:hypothetical protein
MDSQNPASTLPEALAIAEPLVAWLLRSGVGYGEFTAALKLLFLTQAQRELEQQGTKPTDSALSLLSGLHRKDVRALRDEATIQLQNIQNDRGQWGKPSMANQVATRWLAEKQWPDEMPFAGSTPSFESLAREVSRDVHPRSILLELQRLGLVAAVGDSVRLLREALIPNTSLQEARSLLAGAVSDHLHAGVHNLNPNSQGKFLEQSVFADGLSPESVRALQQLANTLWSHVLSEVVKAATPLCEQDQHHPQPQRFRLGVYSYSALETTATSPDSGHTKP